MMNHTTIGVVFIVFVKIECICMAHYNVSPDVAAEFVQSLRTWQDVVGDLAEHSTDLVYPNPNPNPSLTFDIEMVGGDGLGAWLKGKLGLTGKAPGDSAAATAEEPPAGEPPAEEQAPAGEPPAATAEEPPAAATAEETPAAEQAPAAEEQESMAAGSKGKIKSLHASMSWIYIAFASIGIFCAFAMSIVSLVDYIEIVKYRPVARSEDTFLMYKDTIEHAILSHNNKFSVFKEHKSWINVVMFMALMLVCFVLIHALTATIMKVLNPEEELTMSDMTKDKTLIAVMVTFFFEVMVTLLYYTLVNRRILNSNVLKTCQAKVNKVENVRAVMRKYTYNGPDNVRFYSNLVQSIDDNGRAFRNYIMDNSKRRKDTDIAKMMFTFNLYNFYMSQYNTAESFINTPMYKYFSSSPAASKDINPVLYVNVMAVENTDTVANVFAPDAISAWYSLQRPG